jgi:hypothetical protein
MKKLFIILALSTLTSFVANGQTIKFEIYAYDSVLIFCKYNDLIKAVKKSQSGEGKKFDLDRLKRMKETHSDTILMDKNYDFGQRETQWLVRHRKVVFFDKRSNKVVKQLKRIKTGIKGQVLNYTYYDADTNNKLFDLGIKSWQKF